MMDLVQINDRQFVNPDHIVKIGPSRMGTSQATAVHLSDGSEIALPGDVDALSVVRNIQYQVAASRAAELLMESTIGEREFDEVAPPTVDAQTALNRAWAATSWALCWDKK